MEKRMNETRQRVQQFEKDFSKLKSNREKISLDLLRTKYAKAYHALTESVNGYVDWFMDLFFAELTIPLHKNDEVGNKWRADKEAQIRQEEKQPGGLYDQAKAALKLLTCHYSHEKSHQQ